MKRISPLLAIAAVSMMASPVGADSGFRCETGRLVGLGDHMFEVKKKCGDPDFVSQRTERRTVKVKVRRFTEGGFEEVSEEREVEVPIDEWTYDFGPRRFIQHVAFENARVAVTKAGEYGSKKQR